MPRLLLSLALVAALGCGDDSQGPPEPATGDYAAVQLTSSVGGFVTDHISEGAVVTLALLEGGATAGHAFVPGAGEGGEDVDVDLGGAWNQSGNRVTLDLEADIFLEDVLFTHADGVLSADQTFDGVRIRITLVQEALL